MINGMQPAMTSNGKALGLPRVAHEDAAAGSALAVCIGLLFSARTIFVLVSARWLNIGTEPGVLAGFLLSAALVFVALIAAIGRPAQELRVLMRARPFHWVLGYMAFAACSLLWSASASPASSALYWAALCSDVLLVVLLFRASVAESAARSLALGFTAGAVLLSAVAWIMPPESDLRLGDIDYFNTNQIGNLCALALLLGPVVVRRGSAVWRLTAFFLAITLLRSLSKSTLIAFVVAQAYRLVRDPAISRRGKWLMVIGAIVAVGCFWTLLDAYYGVYTAGNRAETLTGRTAIWAWSIGAVMQHPWIGNGFDAMWKVAPPFGGELFEARHAENELLQQFFAYGVCGIVLLAGIYGSLWRTMRRLPREFAPAAFIALLVYAVVRGITEAEPFDLLLPLWLITALVLLIHVRLHAPHYAGSPPLSRGLR